MHRRIVVLALGAVAFASAISGAPAAPPSRATSELLVGFRAGVSAAQQERVLRGVGASRGRRLGKIRAEVLTVTRRDEALASATPSRTGASAPTRPTTRASASSGAS